MPSTTEKSENGPFTPYFTSPTILFSLILVAVYLTVGVLGGDLVNPPWPLVLVQCDNPLPIFPWTLVTSIFLHASIIHIAGNVLFLLVFGFILEEQITKTRWITTFFLTGIAGNLTFVGADLAGFALTGVRDLSCGVGASGAIYGIMGAATGVRGVILIIFIAGLDVFAGGGFFAHIGGLVTGLLLRRFWNSELKNF